MATTGQTKIRKKRHTFVYAPTASAAFVRLKT